MKFEFSSSPRFWLAALIFWAVTLFILSSLNQTLPDGGPEIPHIDKILHFGYFFGGGMILTTWLLLKKGDAAPLAYRVVLPILIFAVIGILDEYHQTFTPGRSGNDPFDWLADLLGASIGVFLTNRFHPIFEKRSSNAAIISED